MKKKKCLLPHFATEEEEARFWSEHDTTEFEDAWEDTDPPELSPHVTLRICAHKEAMQTFSIRLPKYVIKKIRRVAEEKGLPCASLIRCWVMDELEKEAR